MRIFRWLFWLLLIGTVGWLGATVKVGRRTLWGHLRAIAGTREAQELADDTRHEAQQLAERLKRLMADGGAPSEQITDEDRAGLRRLVKERTQAVEKLK